MDFQEYLRIVCRRWPLVLACVLLTFAVGLLLVVFSTQAYEAEADLVFLKSGALLNLEPKYQTVSDINSPTDIASRRRALIAIGKSPALASSVIAKLGDQLEAIERLPTVLLQKVDITIDGDAIKVKARASTAQKAATLANTWADAYRAQVNDIYADNPTPLADIQSQADLAKRDYDDKEKALVAFLSSNKIAQLTAQIALRQQKLADTALSENKLDRAIADASALRAHIAAGTSNSTLGDQLSLVLLEASAFNAASQLPLSTGGQTASAPLNVQLRLDQLNNASTAELLRELDGTIAVLTERRASVRTEGTGTLQGELNDLQAQLEQATARQQELTRSRDLAASGYNTLLNKLGEARLAAQTKNSILQLGVPAIAPDTVVSSNRTLTLLLALAVGLLLGVSGAFMLELVSKNVDNEEQAVRLLGLPVLASVPQPGSIRHNGQAGANVELPSGFGGESFRLLRHNLALNRPGWRSFQVTSAVAGEGKSFIAANLAITCAQQGSKVVLVDANLHRPSQHTRFQVPNASGLSDLLLNRALHSNKFIQPTQIENLGVLPAGGMAKEASALLNAGRFAQIRDALAQTADVIVVDSPAVLENADAALIASSVDAVLLVVRQAHAHRDDAVHARQLLLASGATLAGIVLNGASQWYARRIGPPVLDVPMGAYRNGDTQQELELPG